MSAWVACVEPRPAPWSSGIEVYNNAVDTCQILNATRLCLQEVPALLSLPQGTVGNPIWLIMTGVTTGIQGYNRLISKIVPLTAAARSIDLIPFMVVRPLTRASPEGPHSTADPLSPLVEASYRLLQEFPPSSKSHLDYTLEDRGTGAGLLDVLGVTLCASPVAVQMMHHHASAVHFISAVAKCTSWCRQMG